MKRGGAFFWARGILSRMACIVLFEDDGFVNLLPLVYWRSVFELRYGSCTLLNRAAQKLETPVCGVWTRDWVARVAQQRCCAPANVGVDDSTVLVNGRWITDGPVDWPHAPHAGVIDGEIAYVVCDADLASQLTPDDLLKPDRRLDLLKNVPRQIAPGRMIHYPWDLVCDLADLLTTDWHPHDRGVEVELDRRVHLENTEQIHIGPCTHIHPTAVVSAATGPVYIAEDVTISAHCVIEGPAHIGAGSKVNPHAWLHGGNVIGPSCKVGGELDGCVFQGFSNKQHDGFVGHAYLGQWVNLGACTSNSDLKNDYGNVKVLVDGELVDTGSMFVGATIGDHTKTGINTILNTGTVLGVGCNIFGADFPPKYIPSFSWGGAGGLQEYRLEKCLQVARRVMGRRQLDLTAAGEQVIRHVFQETARERKGF